MAFSYKIKEGYKLTKYDLSYLYSNSDSNILDFLEKSGFDIQITDLCLNNNDKTIETMIKMVEVDKVKLTKNDYFYLGYNNNPKVIKLLNENYYWIYLSSHCNYSSINTLKKNKKYIIWKELAKNTNKFALEILEEYLEELNKKTLYEKIIIYLYKFLNKEIKTDNKDNKIEDLKKIFNNLSSNCSNKAIEILIKNPKHINWKLLLVNKSNAAIDYIFTMIHLNSDKIDYGFLCMNTNYRLYDYFLENPDKITWSLSNNSSDWAVKILEIYPKKICWYHLALNNQNTNAIKLLYEKLKRYTMNDFNYNFYIKNTQDLDSFDSRCILNLLQNLHTNSINTIYKQKIFQHFGADINIIKKLYPFPTLDKLEYKYNYDFIKERNSIFKEELIAYVWNPNRFERWPENPFIDYNEN